MKRVYNIVRDSYSNRDYRLQLKLNRNLKNVRKVDLRNVKVPIYNQGELGSCTANAVCGAFQYDQMIQNLENFMPSRLFVYWNERNMEGTVSTDSGAMLRDGIKSLAKYGVCPETMWPYDIEKFRNKPTDECYKDALHHQAMKYSRVERSLNQMKQCLLDGYPFVFGIKVYSSFESEETSKNGVVTMPKMGEDELGGHALVCVGFKDNKKQFIFRNSWGESWGDNGYGYIPYEYLLNENLASDFWAIQSVEGSTVYQWNRRLRELKEKMTEVFTA